MPVDCSNPTNNLGQTAADPCQGPIDCLKDDYNSWVLVVKEEGGLAKLARERLVAEVLTQKLKTDDPERAKQVERLAGKLIGFQTKAMLLQPRTLPTVTDISPDVFRVRDMAIEGCGLIEQARIALRKADKDTAGIFGKLDAWETSRHKAPIGYQKIGKIAAAVLGVVAVLGGIGYAATAIARAQAAGKPEKARG